jgi:hypothetical protein
MEDITYFKISLTHYSQIKRNVLFFILTGLVWLIYWSVEYITVERLVALCFISIAFIYCLFDLPSSFSMEWLLLEMDGELTIVERDKTGRLTTTAFHIESGNWLFGFMICLRLRPCVANVQQKVSLLLFSDQVSKSDWCRIRRFALRHNNG